MAPLVLAPAEGVGAFRALAKCFFLSFCLFVIVVIFVLLSFCIFVFLPFYLFAFFVLLSPTTP